MQQAMGMQRCEGPQLFQGAAMAVQPAEASQQPRTLGGDLTNVAEQQERAHVLGHPGPLPPVLPAFGGGNNTATFAALAPLTLPLGSLSLPMTSLASPNGLTPLAVASPGPVSPAFVMPSLASPGPLGSPVSKTVMPPKKVKSIGRL
uniref:Uncharacterized protein n=1 Tax=Pyrodinium bahamense TaxID=73915 RepID=A0A7S0B8G4_9DINO